MRQSSFKGLALTTIMLLASTAPCAAQAQAVDASATAEQVEALQKQVQALQAQLDALKQQLPKAVPSWKGAPQWDDASAGFTFKPKGTLQFDAGYVGYPGDPAGTVGPVSAATGASGVNTNNLGFNTRFRRVIIGAEGALPGGFGYNVEFELSQAGVNYEDIVLTYQRKGSPLQLKLGYQFPLSSLELMSSSRFVSFMERAGSTDAFGYTRRMGLSASYAKPQFLVSAGLFGDDVANSNFNRTGWQASTRAVWMPKFGTSQLHLGVNAQYRTAARDAQNVRLRQRPYTQITDQRPLDTGRIAADGDMILGVEAAGIFKSFHVAGEAQWLKVRAINDPAHVFAPNNGTGGAAAFLADDPTFFSGYVEAGYFLTGESRGYKGGRWDRTKVLHPFDKGGWGAVQLNARVDRTDLQDRVGTGAITPGSLNFVNGGKQTGYQLGVSWLPTDYLRFIAQYGHVDVTGGPAAAVPFAAATGAFQDRSYKLDTMTVRAQVDF